MRISYYTLSLLHDFCSRHVRGRSNAPASEKRSGNTTPPPAAVNEETLSAMEDDSFGSQQHEGGRPDSRNRVVNADGIGEETILLSSLGIKKLLHRNRCKQKHNRAAHHIE
ncbi:hypothetical protein TNCV_879071 [Trichonephila clavipes]|nr:hypothetical protein TNCV_879071 [Trichonephila clavipes]